MEKLIASGFFGMMNSGTAYVIGAIVCVLVSYLIGSVNFTRIFADRYEAFPDTMGLYKKAGGRVAFGAAALDGLKGFLCALIGLLLMPGDGYACLCALVCLIGHAFPIWFKFRGGAGAAVYIGAALVMNPLMALAAFIIGFLFYYMTGYLALGSVSFSLVFTLVVGRARLWDFTEEASRIFLINKIFQSFLPMVITLVIFVIYGSSIGRIINSDEPKLPLRKEKSK
ncbi:MAG: glycerol-3-phosphate acyltransferase [Eubacteriales bacterium]|nr:glycerol-3-phosphate acyltransferase [Eubacterium sp.]MDD7573010.1 glycerol-3-phosphate acyltransferase [Eubacteriales bacterium]